MQVTSAFTVVTIDPPIDEALSALKRPAILDGEIIALDEHGPSRFEWLVNRGKQQGTLVYHVFDVLMLDGKDLRQLPLKKRKPSLARLLVGHPAPHGSRADRTRRPSECSPAHWR
jgi:ATP-dependent DNA ligase